MLDVAGLRFRYGDTGFALRVDELRADAGEAVALVGPSGSGKTTLLHLVAGILTPDAGHVRVGGQELADLGDAARRAFRLARIGLVFQEFELLEYLSVLDNVLLPNRLLSGLASGPASRRLGGAARERARTLAERLGIGDKLARRPAQLSQGERQRAAVCRALVTRPPLLLADEPTGNLDPINKERVLDALLALAAEEQTTLLMVTHDRELLRRFERVVDLRGFLAPEAAA